MRKVFLDDLPRRKNGRISWQESIGYKINFVYENIEDSLTIVDYRNLNNNSKVKIEYKGDVTWVGTSSLKSASGFAKLIGYKQSKLNENYFHIINTSEKAYILGFMYADGTVYPKRAKLDLQIDDIHILEQIKREINIETPIRVYKDQKTWFYNEVGEKITYPKKDTARLWMHSSQISKDLSRHGCFQNKTYDLKFPNNEVLPEILVRDFIRGYFDGDGSLTYSARKSNHDESLHFNMSFTGTYEIVSQIKNILNKDCCNFVGDIRSRRNNGVNNYTLTICGNDILLKICEYMYDGCTIKLDRKYEKYKMLIEEIERRNDNPFMNNKKPFKLYKNGEYIDTFESARILEQISEKRFGTKLTNQAISACLNKKYSSTNVYKGFTFELIA